MRKPDRFRSLDLATIDALDTATHDFADIGAAMERQRNDTRCRRIEIDSQEQRQTVIYPDQLDQRGRVAQHGDIQRSRREQDAILRKTQYPDDDTDQHPRNERGERDCKRDPEPGNQEMPVVPDHAESKDLRHGLSVQASRNRSKLQFPSTAYGSCDLIVINLLLSWDHAPVQTA